MQRWKRRRRSRTVLLPCAIIRGAIAAARAEGLDAHADRAARAHARGARRFEKAAPQHVQQVGGKWLLQDPCNASLRRKCADASRSCPMAARGVRSFSMLTFDAMRQPQMLVQLKIVQHEDVHVHELQRRAARRHDDRERRPRSDRRLEQRRGSGHGSELWTADFFHTYKILPTGRLQPSASASVGVRVLAF